MRAVPVPPSPPPSPAPSALAPRASSIYQHPGFLAFIVARVAAMFATQVQAVVVAWQVYDLTREPMALACVGLAQFLPMLALLLPAGDLIDRVQRKRILCASWAVGAVCSAALWWLAGHGAAGVAGIYAVLVLFGASRAFSAPALQSLLPQVVPRERLGAGHLACGSLHAPVSDGVLQTFLNSFLEIAPGKLGPKLLAFAAWRTRVQMAITPK